MNKQSLSKKISLLALLLLTTLGIQAQSWDFTSTPAADVTLLSADTDNWTYTESNNRYSYNNAITQTALTANGSELAMTSGLLFTTTGSDRLRIDANKRLILNGSSTLLTIPNLTAGQTVTITFASSSSSTARTLTPDNLSSTSGFEAATSSTTQTGTGTVTADGDLTFTPDGGIYVYSLKVTDATSGDGSGTSGGALSSDNSTGFNSKKVQAIVTTNDGTVRYYNTEDLTAIEFDDDLGTMTVSGESFSDVYSQLTTNLTFSKAADEGTSGTVTADGLEVTEAKGWLESAYAEWNKLDDGTTYTVEVKGGQYSDYTAIDAELVRVYSSYVRADAVGLTPGNYSMRITATQDGTQVAQAEISDLIVEAYSREGFAHKDYTGVGAYNDDGTLKDNAVVVYVDADNAATVSATLSSGTFTGMQAILNAYQKGNVTNPLAMRILGLIKADDVDSFESSSEGIQIKGKNADSEMNITIEGIGEDATIHGFGFLIRNCKSVEMRNIGIMRQMDDGISLDTDNSNIWLHNIDVFYGEAGSGDHAKGDGAIDVKSDSKYVTIDHCHFWDTGKSSMAGMKSESGPNYITYHHNWFDHSDSRHARVRTMSVHIWNNYFDGCAKYGIGATSASSVFSENNYFRATKDPIMISLQGTDAKGSGTFSGEDGGMVKEYGSIFTEKGSSSNYTPITYADNNTSFDFYEASSRDEQVPETVVTLEGGTSYNNFDTDASLMYSYEVDATANVPAEVTGYYGAGRLNHGSLQYTFDNSVEDTNYDPITELETLIDNYAGEDATHGTSDGSSDSDAGEDNNEDDESGDTTSGDTTITAAVECTFDKSGTPSNSLFTVVGNGSNSKGEATVNGTTYTTCLKMESSTSVTFTTEVEMTLTLVFSETVGAWNIKVDGTKLSSDTNVLTTTLAAGEHTLTKADTANLFYIGLAE